MALSSPPEPSYPSLNMTGDTSPTAPHRSNTTTDKLRPSTLSDATVSRLSRLQRTQVRYDQRRVVVTLDAKTSNMEVGWTIFEGPGCSPKWTRATQFNGRPTNADSVPAEVVFHVGKKDQDGLNTVAASGWVGRTSKYADSSQFFRLCSLKMGVDKSYMSWADGKSGNKELADKALIEFINKQIITTVKNEAQASLNNDGRLPEVWHIVLAVPASWPISQHEVLSAEIGTAVDQETALSPFSGVSPYLGMYGKVFCPFFLSFSLFYRPRRQH
jgi:hypothetical protein